MARRDDERVKRSAAGCARDVAARHPGRPAFVLQFDCAGRGGFAFGDKTTETVVTPLQEALGGDVPWLGFHCHDEIAQVDGRAYYHKSSATRSR